LFNTFLLTVFSALIWGDLTTISCGTMVATGDENLVVDLMACFLGSFFHDIILFYLGLRYSEKIKSIEYFKKRLILKENNIYLNYYKNNILSKFLLYKFISKITISIPLQLGITKINLNEYSKVSLLLNFLFITFLFLVSYYLNLAVLIYDEIPRLENITGAILSLFSFLIYKLIVKIVFKENR
jgi:membrane protein DedA with SNARE-associated domain